MDIELININKKNEVKNILRNINLTIKSNNILSIIGPNGSGKTSLLRIIGLIDKQTTGKLLFDKKEIKLQADKLNMQRKIGIVFTKPELLDMNVYENIIYPMKIREIDQDTINKRIKYYSKLLKLDKIISQHHNKISSGEKQRVAIARTLIYEPELILFDEPTANLDPNNTKIIETTIREISKHINIIVITHDIFQAKRLSDEIGILINGELIEIEKTRKIFTNPNNPNTKAFLNGDLV